MEKAKFCFRLIALVVGVGMTCSLAGPGSLLARAQTGDTPNRPIQQKGNVLYRVPDGWKETTRDSSTLLIPADVSKDRNCLILLPPGQEFHGDLKRAFEKLLDNAAVNGEKVLQTGYVQAVTLASAPNVPAYQKTFLVEGKDGNRTVRTFVAAHPGKKRVEFAVLIANTDDALKHYQDDIKTFLATWTFANIGGKSEADDPPGGTASVPEPQKTKPQASEPKARQGELTGLWFGQRVENQYNGFSGTLQLELIRTWYYFLPGGRVYRGLPSEGTAAFDWQQHLSKDPGRCGTYRLEDGKIAIAWQGNPKPSRMVFSRKGNSLKIGSTSLEQMVTPVGARFAGTYGLTTYTAVRGGGVSGDRKIVLRGNGQFEETGFVGFTVSSQGTDTSGRSRNGGSGTYRITENGLELTYSDGTKRRSLFQVPASQVKKATPGFLMLNGIVWLKR
jgi:hypothetical protein